MSDETQRLCWLAPPAINKIKTGLQLISKAPYFHMAQKAQLVQMVERGNFGRKSSSLKLNGSPLGKLTFQWFKRLPRAHSVGVIIVKIMNQLLDVRQLLVEVLEVGPCLLVFLIFLILLILFHNTSFDNLKAEKLRTKSTSKCSPRSSSP